MTEEPHEKLHDSLSLDKKYLHTRKHSKHVATWTFSSIFHIESVGGLLSSHTDIKYPTFYAAYNVCCTMIRQLYIRTAVSYLCIVNYSISPTCAALIFSLFSLYCKTIKLPILLVGICSRWRSPCVHCCQQMSDFAILDLPAHPDDVCFNFHVVN